MSLAFKRCRWIWHVLEMPLRGYFRCSGLSASGRFLVVALVTVFSLHGTEERRPNILFILSDDHTSQAWGVYDSILNPVIFNPNIARLADEGCLLTNAFCANSICVPSRATILTGQHSHRNGAYRLSDALDPEKETVATTLQRAGYQTALFGKWHLKKKPSGFDSFRVLSGQGRYWNPLLKDAENWKDGSEGGRVYEGFSADVIADLCLDWLKDRDGSKPFMLMCHFKATHEPFDYPKRHAGLYQEMKMPEPASLYEFSGDAAGRTFLGQRLEILGERFKEGTFMDYPGEFSLEKGLSPREVRSAIYQKFVKDFLRCGKAIDDNIGKLLDYLDTSGLADNTIVIYTADQGYFLGEHGFFDKRIMYEEPLRMPFVIRYPKEIPAGSRLADMIQNIDFAPLLLDYAEAEKMKNMDGRSFRSNLSGETPDDWRDAIYYRYWQHQENRPAHYGIRTASEKLIHFYGTSLQSVHDPIDESSGTWEYYDLLKDPKELRNLYASAGNQESVSVLKRRLLELRRQVEQSN